MAPATRPFARPVTLFKVIVKGGAKRFAFFLAPVVIIFFFPPLYAAEDLAGLVEQLDDAEFAVRQKAEQLLIQRGEPALAVVLPAVESPSRETSSRARRIVRIVHHHKLLADFRNLGRTADDAPIDLERGLYLVSRISDPLLQRETIDRQLDALAADVRQHLKKAAADRPATEPEKIKAVLHVLFVKHSFHGNTADYANPDNSSLARVLATHQGLPVLLSQLTIAVGRRVGVKLHGVSLSRRYVVWYEPPPGHAHEEMIIDAFDGGKVLTRDDLEDLLASLGVGFDQMADLSAAPNRDTLQRVLRNLIGHLEQAGRHDQADDARQHLKEFGE